MASHDHLPPAEREWYESRNKLLMDRKVPCSKCGREVIQAITDEGKKILLDAGPEVYMTLPDRLDQKTKTFKVALVINSFVRHAPLCGTLSRE